MSDRRTILILSANPRGTSQLRLDEEMREIKEGLRRAKSRDQFIIETAEAVRYRDIRRAMLDINPQIVHFSGHGTGSQGRGLEPDSDRKLSPVPEDTAEPEGLVFEDEAGHVKLVDAKALAGLFELFTEQVECVVLNACYSQVQAESIARYIPYVIGMKKAIGDRAAIEFAVGFYDALGAGKSYDFAYKLGCNAIQLAGIAEEDIPTCLKATQMVSIPAPDQPSQPAASPLSTKPMTSQRVFISYRSQEPDASLAQEFHDRLVATGHEAFMAAASIRWGENWIERIDAELKRCDYFLLLLSEQSASSDMVAGEVRTARELRDKLGKPVILPVRVNLPLDDPLNYELRSFLQTIQQRQWNSEADTPVILSEILALLSTGAAPEPVEELNAKPVEAKPNRPPLPVAELELPGGTMQLASPFYVQREPWESRCFEQIENNAGLIRIKAPRQMGKTSLLARICNHAVERGYRTATLDFLGTDEAIFKDLTVFLKRFCALISRKLGINPRQVSESWDEEMFGPKDNCNDYFEQYVLKQLTVPLFLGLDELDRIFPHNEVAKEFFALLRSWNEQAKVNETWAKLRLAIVHSTESYVVMDTNSSPFNVGLAVELPEFSQEQVLDLVARHGLSWGTGEVQQLMAMVGGHPYLVRLALYHVAQGDLTLPELLAEAPTDAGIYGEHLRRHLWNLQQNPDLAEAFQQVVGTGNPVSLPTMLAFKLNGMGLVSLAGNDVTPRHERLYRPYFQSRLRTKA